MSVNCKKIENSLLAVIDGRATTAEREQVSAHMATCAACARRAKGMGAVWKSLELLEAVEPSPAFDARLRARMSEEPERSLWPRWLRAHAKLAALATVVAAVAIWFSVRPLMRPPAAPSPVSQEDFAVVKNLPVLENYDLLSNFDALSALPGAQKAAPAEQQPVD